MLRWLLGDKPKPQTLGQIGEALAQLEYERRGYRIVTKNFFNRSGKRLGEIDFIARNNDSIIFVEVKIRAQDHGRFGTPVEAVNQFKQLKLLKAVKVFLLGEPDYQKLRPQIDVCAIVVKDLGQLEITQHEPVLYRPRCGLDKLSCSVTIIANAVEDWG